MKIMLAIIKHQNILSKTLKMALFIGVMTIVLVLNVHKSNDVVILSVGKFIGSIGNDVFIIISNLIIIGWALRKRLKNVIKLTLKWVRMENLDFLPLLLQKLM